MRRINLGFQTKLQRPVKNRNLLINRDREPKWKICLRVGVLLTIYFILLCYLTYYKGFVWGVVSPLAGILIVSAVQILYYKGRIYSLSCLFLLAIIMSSVVHHLYEDETNSESALSTYESPIFKNAIPNDAHFLKWPEGGTEGAVYFLGILPTPWIVVPSNPQLILKPVGGCYTFDGSSGTFLIDLTQSAKLDAFSLTRGDIFDNNTWPRQAVFEVSNDLIHWTHLGEYDLMDSQLHFFKESSESRYVSMRVNGREQQQCISLGALGLYTVMYNLEQKNYS